MFFSFFVCFPITGVKPLLVENNLSCGTGPAFSYFRESEVKLVKSAKIEVHCFFL